MGNANIVVLGGAGMLGHKLFQVLRERFPGTVATTRASVAGRRSIACPFCRDPTWSLASTSTTSTPCTRASAAGRPP